MYGMVYPSHQVNIDRQTVMFEEAQNALQNQPTLQAILDLPGQQ